MKTSLRDLSSISLIGFSRVVPCIILLASFFSTAMAQRQAAPEEEVPLQAVTASRIIVNPYEPTISNGVILFRGKEIIEVGSRRNVRIPDGTKVIDLGNRTVLPGLMDSHTHLSTTNSIGAVSPSTPLSTIRAIEGIKNAASMGVTTMRVVGSPNFVDVGLRDAVNEGLIAGPRIIPAGHAFGPPGGHTDRFTNPASVPMDDFYIPLNGFISSVADAEKAVNLQFKYGAQVIKVNASGGYGSPLDNPYQQSFSDEEFRVIADTAHRLGMKVTAHAENVDTIKAAVRAGFDSIDHASELDDEAIELMLERGTCIVPTVVVPEFTTIQLNAGNMPPAIAAKLRKYPMDAHIPSYQKAYKAGVKVAAGSDGNYGSGPSINLIRELETQAKYGMSPKQTLASATVDAAECAGFGDQFGTLEKGKSADLIAVDGDPLRDISVLNQVDFVMREGCILSSSIDDAPATSCR
jgi:imidazolonepropionase-like amidohydrolase